MTKNGTGTLNRGNCQGQPPQPSQLLRELCEGVLNAPTHFLTGGREEGAVEGGGERGEVGRRRRRRREGTVTLHVHEHEERLGNIF